MGVPVSSAKKQVASTTRPSDKARSIHNEDQSGCTTRAQVLCVDWWFNPLLFEYLPADVDLEGGVRRVWAHNCAPQVLLSRFRIEPVLYGDYTLRFMGEVCAWPAWPSF